MEMHTTNKAPFPLQKAAYELDLAAMKRLIQAGHDVNGRDGEGKSALHHVQLSTNSDKALANKCIKYLEEVGADIDLADNEGEICIFCNPYKMESLFFGRSVLKNYKSYGNH